MKKIILLLIMSLTIANCAVSDLPNIETKNENKSLKLPTVNLKESLTSIKGK